MTTDGGQSWNELAGLREHSSGPQWQPGAGGMCLHTIVLHPTDEQRIFTAISAAGAFRTDDGGVHGCRPRRPRSRTPVLRGTLRDEAGKRRAFVRFFACQEDLSHTCFDDPLPAAVLEGREPFLVIGAMAGG